MEEEQRKGRYNSQRKEKLRAGQKNVLLIGHSAMIYDCKKMFKFWIPSRHTCTYIVRYLTNNNKNPITSWCVNAHGDKARKRVAPKRPITYRESLLATLRQTPPSIRSQPLRRRREVEPPPPPVSDRLSSCRRGHYSRLVGATSQQGSSSTLLCNCRPLLGEKLKNDYRSSAAQQRNCSQSINCVRICLSCGCYCAYYLLFGSFARQQRS